MSCGNQVLETTGRAGSKKRAEPCLSTNRLYYQAYKDISYLKWAWCMCFFSQRRNHAVNTIFCPFNSRRKFPVGFNRDPPGLPHPWECPVVASAALLSPQLRWVLPDQLGKCSCPSGSGKGSWPGWKDEELKVLLGGCGWNEWWGCAAFWFRYFVWSQNFHLFQALAIKMKVKGVSFEQSKWGRNAMP